MGFSIVDVYVYVKNKILTNYKKTKLNLTLEKKKKVFLQSLLEVFIDFIMISIFLSIKVKQLYAY